MFQSDSIPALIDLFKRRGVLVYHACQYKDFLAYLALGGIPSRAKLEKENLSMTSFTTDDIDKENRVWNKVFLNLEDFGRAFANDRVAVPNVYGPILFRLRPEALSEATDVAICLRSAGARGFDRQRESLKSLEDVNELFYYPADHHYGSAFLKFKPLLQERFGPTARSVEISCTASEGFLTFTYLIDIVVDPYVLGNQELPRLVNSQVNEAGLKYPVKERKAKIGAKLYQVLLAGARTDPPSPTALAEEASSSILQKWAEQIQNRGGLLLKNYYRFLKYLHEGTVLPMVEHSKNERQIERLVSLPGTEEVSEDNSQYEYYRFDGELDSLLEELDDYREGWTRSSEEGWFYPD